MTEKKPKRPRAKPAAPARPRRPAVPKHKDRAELVSVGPATVRVTFPKDEEVPQGSSAYKWTVPPKPSRFDLLAVARQNLDRLDWLTIAVFLLSFLAGVWAGSTL